MKKLLQKTKRGGASMFVVMFTVIILSIIVLGFTRLILAEAMKTTNTDLSQSAYDSALAGIEDAKIALLQYHKCLDQGNRASGGDDAKCVEIINDMQDGIREVDCSTVQKVLNRDQEDDNHAVVVQETQKSNEEGNNANMVQAYTCVTIQEDLEDYRTTLNSSNRLRIIPLRSDMIDSIDHIKIQWYSSINDQIQDKATGALYSEKYCGKSDVADNTQAFYPLGNCTDESSRHSGTGQQAPTVLTARLIQTDEFFNISELSTAYSQDWTDTGQLYFVPVNNGGTNNISISKWGESANKGENHSLRVNCSQGTWYCRVDIDLPKTFNGNSIDRSDANAYLLVSIPYGSPETDISVQMFSGGIRYDFTGVQARIDSTGVANDLYRRVETRVELVDTYFAYPEFDITMRGDPEYTVKKSFDSTFSCWNAENGSLWDCDDSTEDDYYANL